MINRRTLWCQRNKLCLNRCLSREVHLRIQAGEQFGRPFGIIPRMLTKAQPIQPPDKDRSLGYHRAAHFITCMKVATSKGLKIVENTFLPLTLMHYARCVKHSMVNIAHSNKERFARMIYYYAVEVLARKTTKTAAYPADAAMVCSFDAFDASDTSNEKTTMKSETVMRCALLVD